MSPLLIDNVNIEKAYFAGGCFWGVQYLLEKEKGVISSKVGYTGGHTTNPTYQEVCGKTTGHVETLEVTFNPSQTTFEVLARLFFEIHDFTQTDGQGPDIGEQYRSVIFFASAEQKKTAHQLIDLLKAQGYQVATSVEPLQTFWDAEDYHQYYYDKMGKQPYCHAYRKIWNQ